MSRPLIALCVPSRCAHCAEITDAAAPLCQSCEDKLAKLESQPACLYCAKPLTAGSVCGWCRGKGIPHFNRIARLGVYEEPLRSLIVQMKYQSRWPYAGYFAKRLARLPSVQHVLESIDCIVPVPLHWRRQIVRGYNQADLLARALHQHFDRPVVRSAVRVRHTPTQTRLSATARGENLRGAFGVVTPSAIRGKRVLLVDDVMTSGATLQHLAREMIKAEPQSLDALVLAIADAKHADFRVS